MLFLDGNSINVFIRLWRSLIALFCDGVYWLVAGLYRIFMTMAKVNFLGTTAVLPIYQRVTMILTIVMTFYITFEFVKYSINPDDFTDKEKGFGNILKKIVIVVALLAFTPHIFNLAYRLQSKVIDAQVIPKIILGRTSTNHDKVGNEFSSLVLGLFYEYDANGNCRQAKYECSDAKDAVDENLRQLKEKGISNIHSTINYSASSKTTDEGVIRKLFKTITPAIKFGISGGGVAALLVGGFIGYILILYSIDLGTRYAQLVFLQIIAPIAIMGYMLPKKDGIFQKWLSQCVSTYIDVFLRIAIIDVIIFLIKSVGELFSSKSLFGSDPAGIEKLAYVAIVLGLLAFAQKAPKLLGELLPTGKAGIGFGLKAAERVAPGAARAIGAGAGALNSAVRGGIGKAANAFRSNRENIDRRRTKDEIGKSKTALREKNRALREARQKLNHAKTPEQIKAAREAYRNARKEQVEAASQVANDKNAAKRNVVGAALTGALGGAGTGLTTGGKATKLGDIGKQVKEAQKKTLEDVASIQKYYDSGGTSETARTLTHIQQGVGIQTASQRTAEEIRRLDAEIKKAESDISIERAPKKAVDDAEGRGQAKAKEGQLKIKVEDVRDKGIKIPTGVAGEGPVEFADYLTKNPNATLSDVYKDYEKKAEEAKSALDAAIKAKENAKTDAEKAAWQTKIEKLSEASSKADTRATAVLKGVSRAAFEMYARSDKPLEIEGNDPVMVNFVENVKNSIVRACESPYTKAKVVEEIERLKGYKSDPPDPVKDPKMQALGKEYEKIYNGDYRTASFDNVDGFKNFIDNLANEREREISATKAVKSTIETSSMYDEQKANADGGKK